MAPAAKSMPRQHGVKGVYYGGEWLDLEECDGKFQNVEKCSNCTNPKPCPRSRSANSAQDANDMYDVCIIGAGCIGAAVARELSKYKLGVLWLEAADDVSQGATKGNSGIVHAGYDDKPGTNRAKYCWKGNQMFADLDRDLRFGYQTNGSLVIATKESERATLEGLIERGQINGVERLRIIEKDELFEMEPHVNPNAIAALYSPDAGNVIPYEFAIALAENAVDNGVELRIRREVTAISKDNSDYMELTVRHWEPEEYVESANASPNPMAQYAQLGALGGVLAVLASASLEPSYLPVSLGVCAVLIAVQVIYSTNGKTSPRTPLKKLVEKAGVAVGTGGTKVTVEDMKMGGSGSSRILNGQTVDTETVRAKYIINCAGSYSDKIARMIDDASFTIKPRLGDYLLLHRRQGRLATRTLFPCPDPVKGKGVLVQTTLWGNLILGPTARDMHKPEDADMTPEEIQKFILSKCQELVPSFDPKETIHAFCGARAKSDRGDWIIENSQQDGRMVHVAGIDSPGLAGSPAIAMEVVRILEETGCKMTSDPTFNPRRAPIIFPKQAAARGLKSGPVEEHDSLGLDEAKMASNVVCKCEKVTELEIVRALRRSLPIDSTQAIRKRTRAGMGSCQAKPFKYNCEGRVKAIIARETGAPIDHVAGRPWPATSTFPQRWLEDSEKQAMADLVNN